MKRIVLLLLLSACESSSSSNPLSKPVDVDMPIPSTAPSTTASAAPSASASAAPMVKGNAPAPASLSFCKSISYASEPLSAICAVGQNYDKSHFECAKPLPVNFCADLVEWGCQYVGPNEKAPKTTFDARFVRGGVAPTGGEIITDDSLRARYPRAGLVRGVSVHQKVSGSDEGTKVAATWSKRLIATGCVASSNEKAGSTRLDCGGWQAHIWYIDTSSEVVIDADTPTLPDCTK